MDGRKKTIGLAILITALVSMGAARTVIDAKTVSGQDIDNFDVEITGDDDYTRTGVDSASFNLDEGEYSVTLSKDNYRDLERTIYVEASEDSE
ncbi:MAG: PEGA domain-containing protein, partial [Candidatus Aenigmatarchaeota archaeon]